MRGRLHVILVSILMLELPVCAAEPKTDGPPPAAAGESVRSAEVKPDVYYLRNKDGELVLVPNFSFEKWEELVRLARNLTNPLRPSYVLQEMEITGSTHAHQADLKVVFRVQPRGMDSEETAATGAASVWARIPLHLGQAILEVTPRFQGPGEHFVTFDKQLDGYVLWIQAKPGTQHEVTLNLQVPIDSLGNQRELDIRLPTALVSTLTLQVPDQLAEGTIESGEDNASHPLEFTTKSDKGGEFSARGLRGDITLRWHAAAPDRATSNVQLDVFGSIVVTADEPLSEVESDGRFIVRPYGAPISSFRVRMPPGMRFRDSLEPGYTVHVLPDPVTPAKLQEVEIQLARPTTGELHIRLIAELPPDQNGSSTNLTVKRLIDRDVELEPARFEFVGAARHRGNVNFVVKGDWELQWKTDSNLSRVQTRPTETSSQYEVARFTYFRQPCALKVTLRRKATRISVEPTFDMHLDTQQVRLTTVLVCRTSGAQTPPLAVHMRGWTIETVQFDEGENTSPLDLTEANPLIVPIPLGIQALGRFTLRIEARRELTAGVISGTQPLRVEFPTIESTVPTRANLIVSPATVTVLPADNVAITPRLKETQGLAPLVTSPDSPDQETESPVLRYRDQGGSEAASLVCDYRVRPRSISIVIDSRAALAADTLSVDQHFAYTVFHEPLTTLVLSVPKELIDNQRLNARVLWNEHAVSPVLVAQLGNDRVLCEALLPEPLLGTADLRVQLPRRPVASEASGEAMQLTVPLVFPAPAQPDTTVIDNRLEISYDQTLNIELRGGPWAKDENESTPGTMRLTTASDGADALLQVTREPTRKSDSTVILQTWIQSWMVGPDRRDRAVFRIRSIQSSLTVTLPSSDGRSATLISAAIDGTQIEPLANGRKGTIKLPLETIASNPRSEHVVEIWYSIVDGKPRGSEWTLQAAMIAGVDRTSNNYWQLVLAPGDIVLASIGDSVMERRWEWSWYGMHREPWQEESDLEDLLGATHQDPVPSTTNRYLFVTFGEPHELKVLTTARSLVVLSMSGCALMIGLLLLYVPLIRHPVVLMVGGLTLLGLAAIAPDVATVLGQAAALGVVLIPVAIVTRRLARQSRPSVMSARSGVVRDSKMLEAQFSHGEGSSRIRKSGSSTSTSLREADAEP